MVDWMAKPFGEHCYRVVGTERQSEVSSTIHCSTSPLQWHM